MESFDFVIPLSLDALQEASSTRQYAVTNISSSKELPKKIIDTTVSFRKHGSSFILQEQNFDSLYSVLVNFKAVDEECKEKSWDLLVKAITKLSSEISPVVDENDMSSSDRHRWLNILKMTTYIACTLTEAFEKHSNKPTLDTALITKGRKKSSKKMEDERDWEDDRNQMLNQLYGLLQHPLQRLWDPPIMEEDFVNLIANCCYKILESPNMNLVKTKPTRDSVFQIIGSLVKKFNHGLACSLKLMQLLQHFEHMVTPAAQGIILLINSYDNKSVISEMIREITKTDAKELMKDTSGLRNFSQFIVEVAEKCPQVVMPSLSLLINFLDEEAYVMRNCVLSILGAIVLKVLSGDDLEDKNKDLRDQCLDHLEDHIHDIHAFVRSKVLQIWNDLITEKAVPLRRQQHVLELVLGRLKDRSSTVRKNAVQLLTAFLKGNPFAAKLPLEDLQSQFEIEYKKLKEMDPDASDDPGAEKPTKKVLSPSDKWEAKLPEIAEFILEVVKEGATDDDDDDEDDGEDVLDEESSLNDAVLEVAAAMDKDNIRRAIKLLESALEMFHGAEILSYDPEQAFQTKTDFDATSFSSYQMHILVVLKRIFVSSKSMELRNSQNKEDGKEDEESEDKDPDEEKENPEVTKQKLLVAYLKDSVGFAKLINEGIPVVCQLLGSKQVSDVMEAISFFVTAFEFGLLNAKAGVLKMLVLVWSKEQAIKDAVVEAYQRLYINSDISSDRARAQHIVRNLSALITGSTLGERTSLDEIVSQFVNSGDINKHCVTLMWEKFTKTLPDTTDDEARAALVLLAMCANSEVSIISSNISVLVKSGLGERGEKDFALVKETCSALLKLAVSKPKTDSPNAPFRLEQDHEIFIRLAKILVAGLTRLEDRQYCPMATQAISTIYSLAEHPDIISGEIIQNMATIMQEQTVEAEESNPEDSASQGLLQVPVGILTRFIVVVGHVALCQLVHLDTYIFSELKRRNFLKEEMENEKKSKKKNKNHRKSLITSASEASISKSEPDIDDEMELTGAVADDLEAEYIRSICDSEIIKGENLLDLIRPTILAICSNPGRYSNPDLRAAATLTLSKMMMVSSEFCEDNLQLLFTILEKSEEPVIRANIVIALGDLSFRFPNLLEPWTPRIYARLRDHSPKVRQNTLTILTHLILNDMVKVKGQISDIALCITDEDPRISGLANLFFTELARKGNALYNVLPDIISRLSDAELSLEEQKYRIIIGPIFALLQKDKQLETLAEKLCHRFQATITPRQWRDIAYCLSLLQYNDKSVRKLSENFACYGDKLHEPEVFDFFLGILANARKNSKPEAKAQIDELEAKIQENHDKGVEDENALTNAANAKSKSRKPSKTVTKVKRVRLQVADSSSEDEGGRESGSEDNLSKPPPAMKSVTESQRTRRSSARVSRR
ncbi:condensin complex subunit 1-like [Macrobrachium nipponense]|uniref:condensin complex subunit 1-like n=1 Tax=Macrobrachium nipponense TaxID=159736 RepID=UPI0030C815B8